jgi:hypothetical protein
VKLSNQTIAIGLAALGLALASGSAIGPSFAAAPAPAMKPGLPCSGVWKLDESLTHRTRSPIGPFYQFFESWGPDGWMRMNTGDLATSKSGEWHFEQFSGKPYQVFGGDPSLQHSRKITDHIIETIRVREGKDSDYNLVIFSQDCKHVTYYFPEGEDRHGPPGKTHYINDIRVFDKIEPPQ